MLKMAGKPIISRFISRGAGGGGVIYPTAIYYRNSCFLNARYCVIVRRPNMEGASKMFFCQQIKTLKIFLVPYSTWKQLYLPLYLVVGILPRFLGIICNDKLVLSARHKSYFKNWCLINSLPTSNFDILLNSRKWLYYQK